MKEDLCERQANNLEETVKQQHSEAQQEYNASMRERERNGRGERLCREELCGFGIHLFFGSFERDDAQEDETDQYGDLE